MMRLHFRPAEAGEHQKIQDMVIESFEPITWFKKLDAQIGPLNGRDWRIRWQARMRRVFETQIVLVGETSEVIVAMSSGTIDQDAALAYINLLAVESSFGTRVSATQDITSHEECQNSPLGAIRCAGSP